MNEKNLFSAVRFEIRRRLCYNPVFLRHFPGKKLDREDKNADQIFSGGNIMEKIRLSELEQKLQAQPYVILDFSSPGCAPCQHISHALPAMLAELPGVDIGAYEVDIASEPAIASRFFVLGVPTLILFKNGQEIGRFNSLPKSSKVKQLLS